MSSLLAFSQCRNGIYPLMNFASSRPHPVPRALSLSQEQVETVKTPTPEPQETESRKVGSSLVRSTNKIYLFSEMLIKFNFFLCLCVCVRTFCLTRLQVIQMHCSLESNEEGTKTHVSHVVLKVLPTFVGSFPSISLLDIYVPTKYKYSPSYG